MTSIFTWQVFHKKHFSKRHHDLAGVGDDEVGVFVDGPKNRAAGALSQEAVEPLRHILHGHQAAVLCHRLVHYSLITGK